MELTEREAAQTLVDQDGQCGGIACWDCPFDGTPCKLQDSSDKDCVVMARKWLEEHPVEGFSAFPQGVKYDDGKPRYDLVPFAEWEDVVKVLTFGAKKYSPDNWKHVPEGKSRYIAAAFRHLVARCMGEKNDPETGLPHTAHAICCLLFLGWFDKEEK